MSQVIVTQDNLNARRESTKLQENKIDTNSFTKRWRMNNIAPGDVNFRKLVLVGLTPLFAFWGLLMIGLTFALAIFSVLLRVLGKILPR